RFAASLLTVHAEERTDALTLRIACSTGAFPESRLWPISDQYEALLRRAADSPTARFDALPLASGPSHWWLPDPTCRLATPRYVRVTTRVFDWASRTPDAPAVVQSSRAWSYAHLASAATHIGNALIERGMRPGDTIAVIGTS